MNRVTNTNSFSVSTPFEGIDNETSPGDSPEKSRCHGNTLAKVLPIIFLFMILNAFQPQETLLQPDLIPPELSRSRSSFSTKTSNAAEVELEVGRQQPTRQSPTQKDHPNREGPQQSPTRREDRNSSSSFAAAIHHPDIDWNDKIYRRTGWDNDPVVIESHKLLFFTVPKNSCTEFKMLFRRMMGFEDWKQEQPVDTTHDPSQNGLKYLGSYPRVQQAHFMTSPEWTRAIFLRDPKERVLSAYMDKGLHFYLDAVGGFIKTHCCHMKKRIPNEHLLDQERARMEQKYPHCLPLFPYESNTTKETFPFGYFVEEFMARCPDTHWRLQSKRMHSKTWNLINFVGYLETLQEDGHALLRKVGAFEEFGEEGWGPDNGKIFDSNDVGHATSARTKTEAFYHPNGNSSDTRLEELVLRHYRPDYEHPIMNMTKPENWERLILAPEQKENRTSVGS